MDFQSSDFGFPNRTQNPTKTTKNGFRISFSFVTNSKCGFDIPNLDFPVQIQIFQSKAPWTLGRRKARKAWIDTRYPRNSLSHTLRPHFLYCCAASYPRRLKKIRQSLWQNTDCFASISSPFLQCRSPLPLHAAN